MTHPAPLPLGTRLLHIGPHKTGTTSLQAAFHASRERLAAHRVHYAGKNAHSMAAAMAAISDRPLLATQSGAAADRWQALVSEVRGSEADRVVVSSEFYADALGEKVPEIVEALGGQQVHVVVTLRSLVRILPSQWQQYMQNRMVIPYPKWLEEMLVRAEETTTTPSFWRRHRHDELVRRWVDVVGPERLTVVVMDEQDKGMLGGAFEALLGVPGGTLRSERTANRSLTYAEVETLRELNRLWRERDWSEADYTRLVRFGAARYLQERRPGEDEERLRTPRWAVDRALEIEQEMVEAIVGCGVRVVGDPASLYDAALASDVGENAPVSSVPVDIAARFSAGLVRSVTDVPRGTASTSRVVGPIEAAARRRPPGMAPSAAVRRPVVRRLLDRLLRTGPR